MPRSYFFRAIAGIFVFFFVALSATLVFAWTSPTQSPPNGNVGFWARSGSNLYYNSGNIGIGTTAPSNVQGWGRVLDVNGASHAKLLVTENTAGVKTGIFSHSSWWPGGVGKIGTESSHPLALMAGYGNDVMTLTPSGNVGIGTTGPNAKLDISTSNDWSSGIKLTSSSTAGAGLRLINTDAGGKDWAIISTGSGNGGGAGNLGFYENGGGYRLYLRSGGNVGIGTTNPGAKLDVAGNIRASQWLQAGGAPVGGYGGTSGNGLALPSTTNDAVYIMGEHNGADTSNGVFFTADNAGDGWIFRNTDCCGGGTLDYAYIARAKMYYIGGNVGIGTTNPGAKLEIDATGVSGVAGWLKGIHFTAESHSAITLRNSTAGGLLFGLHGINQAFYFGRYNLDGTWDKYTMAIMASSGRVGIGTTSPGYTLDVAGSAHASTFPVSSDIRFKENIQNLAVAAGSILAKLERLRGVYFDWNQAYKNLGRATDGRQIGLIAQEVEQEFPELVSLWGDGSDYRGVDYGRFSAVLLEGIKELNARTKGLLTSPQGDAIIKSNIGIGTTSPQAKLHVVQNGSQTTAIITDGQARIKQDWPESWGGGLATWDIVGASTLFDQYRTRSDRSKKTDIVSLQDGMIEKINQLRPVSFRWKEQEGLGDGINFGFIAQDVEKIFPELVNGEEGNKSLRYDEFIPLLTKALQEQQEQIRQLQAENKLLQARLEALEGKNY